MPEISIIIPVRNRNEYLKRCLTALINQTYKDFEVLVCDDGGKIKADKIIKSYRKYLNIKYFWNKDRGGMSPATARNIGWNNSQGNYLLFLDSDIILPPKCIGNLYGWIAKYNYRKSKFHVTPIERIHVKKNIPLGIIQNNLININKYIEKDEKGKIYKGNLSISTIGLFHKSIIERIGGFDDILFVGRIYEDIELGARLLGFLNNKRKILPFKVYHLNHYSEFKARDNNARKNINSIKNLIKQKFINLGFLYEKKYRPQKDLINHSEKYYEDLLANKIFINNISRKLANSTNK